MLIILTLILTLIQFLNQSLFFFPNIAYIFYYLWLFLCCEGLIEFLMCPGKENFLLVDEILKLAFKLILIDLEPLHKGVVSGLADGL